MSEAGLLRAMVRNYSRNNLWDHLDAEACTKAANKIDELTEKLIEQAAEIESLRISYDSACRLVAQLHEAVIGEIVGPHHGVVEDVRNKVAWLEATLASEQQDYKEVEAMLHAERDVSQKLRQDLLTSYGESEELSLRVAGQEKQIQQLQMALAAKD